jgi:cobalt-zinc-cadmium efflux system outer membrane protein
MRIVRLCVLYSCAAGFFASGCASVDPRHDFERVQNHIAIAAGQRPSVSREDRDAVRLFIDEALRDGLTVDEALQIALLNNPEVRAAFFTVGMGRADVVQSGLFQNPSLALSVRLPDSGGLANMEFSIAQRIADLWLIPLRKRVAEGELERQILLVARDTSVAILDARRAYYRAVAAGRDLEIAAEGQTIGQQLLDISLARQQAGVGNEIDVNQARAALMETEITVQTAKLAAFRERRVLATTLGLDSSPNDLRLIDALPEPPTLLLTEQLLIDSAKAHRLDLLAADQTVNAAWARVEQERRSVWTNVEFGVSVERDARRSRGDRDWLADAAWASADAGELSAPSLRPREAQETDVVVGPAIGFDLPIFDQNQAQIAKAEFAYRRAEVEREALLVEVTQETREAYERARITWDLSTYHRDRLLPLLDSNLTLSREVYRAGQVSFLSVLEVQRTLLRARAAYVEVLREAAIAIVDLERAIGQPIAALPKDAAPAATPTRPAEPK